MPDSDELNLQKAIDEANASLSLLAAEIKEHAHFMQSTDWSALNPVDRIRADLVADDIFNFFRGITRGADDLIKTFAKCRLRVQARIGQ